MKSVFRTLAFASLIGVAGCTATVADTDQVRFRRIAENLETGGSCYFISSSCKTGAAFEKFIRKNELLLWESPLPHKNKLRLQHLISSSELTARLAGLHNIKGWGGSSKSIIGSRPELFRNKIRLLAAEKSQGALWELLKNKNEDLGTHLYGLPEDTFFAAVLNLTPSALLKFIEADKKISSTTTSVCKILLDKTPLELLSQLSGIWKVVVICDEENDSEDLSGIHIVLTIPDKGGKIFTALSRRLRALPGTAVDPAQQTIKLDRVPGIMSIPFIIRGQDSLTVCTTPLAAARARCTVPSKKLSGTVKTYLNHIRPEGSGLFFSRNLTAGNGFSKKIDLSESQPSLAVVRTLADGLEIEEISQCDLNRYFFHSSLLMSFKLAFENFSKMPAPKKKARPERSSKKQAPVQSASPRKAQDLCRSGIEAVGKKLLEYRSIKKSWPPYGITGLRELVRQKQLETGKLTCPLFSGKKGSGPGLSYANCHYLYFGAPGNDSPKTPLLMEFPFLHKDYFSVFYNDGTVEKIRLSGHRNVRRAISFLHTVHSYEEEEFMRLMQIAAEFDKLLEL